MAHQAGNIPWSLLASNLEFFLIDHPDDNCYTDLHLRYKDNQAKDLTCFVDAFTKTVKEYSIRERRKYPEKYDPPSKEGILLNDDLVRKIGPIIHQQNLGWCWELRRRKERPTYNATLCQHEDEVLCKCTIPYRERKASSFLRQYVCDYRYGFEKTNGPGLFNLEVVKTLLLYDEMDIIFRVCAHPDIDLESWWSVEEDSIMISDVGWEYMCRMALRAYICLNVMYCFPELWDPASGKSKVKDYRRTRVYQDMLRNCTYSGLTSDIVTYPHRDFFGIEKHQFEEHVRLRDRERWADFLEKETHRDDEYPYGLVSIDEFLTIEKLIGYQPHISEVEHVRWMLCRKGLPLELAMDIMDIAEYTPRRRLKVANDPLHPENRDELEKYLDYCWQLLIRCEMMAEAAGMEICWQEEVVWRMIWFWHCDQSCCSGRKWYREKHLTYRIPDQIPIFL